MLDQLSGADLKCLLDTIGAPVFMAEVQPDGAFIYLCLNVELEAAVGLQMQDYAGRTVSELMPEEQAQRVQAQYALCLQSGQSVEFEEFFRFPKGERWWRTTLRPVRDGSGQARRILGASFDITDYKRTRETLRYQHMLLKVQQELMPDGILISDESGNCLSWNTRFKEIWRLDEEQLRQGWEIMLPLTMGLMVDPEAFMKRIEGVYLDLHEAIEEEELKLKDGRTLVWYSRGLTEESEINNGRVWYFRDITQRKAHERRLRELAITDGLTRLWNRRHFLEMSVQVLQRARREQESLSVLLLDIDHFKCVNDSHGHAAGDAALQAVAFTLPQCLRASDLWCRWGGEEFAIVLANTSPQDAAVVSERVRAAIEALEVVHEGRRLRVTASLGLSNWRPHEVTLEPALQRADEALYQAKQTGRNRICTVLA